MKQGAVVYCALEGAGAFRNRAEAFRRKKLNGHCQPIPFYLLATPLALAEDHLALISAIEDQCPAPAAAVIDTLNRSLAGSESSDEDMGNYVKAADAIRDAFDCAVIIVHHCGYEGTRPRGHSSLIGALDAQIAISRDPTNNIAALVEYMKDGKDGPEGLNLASRLEVVDLGVDDDGDTISSCIVMPADGTIGAAANGVLDCEVDDEFVKLVKRFNVQDRNASDRRISYAPKLFAEEPDNSGFTKLQFEAAMRRLLLAGKIRIEDHGTLSKPARTFIPLTEVET